MATWARSSPRSPTAIPACSTCPAAACAPAEGTFTAVVDGQAPRTHVRAVFGVLHLEGAGAPSTDLVAPGDAELSAAAGH